MRENEKFQRKLGRASEQKVQIGPRILLSLKQDLEHYCTNTRQNQEEVIEMALAQFLADKDLTPVVQLQLYEALEVSYGDPRFQLLKSLIERARITTANRHGRQKLLEKLGDEYRRVVRTVGMCVELKMEYEEALARLIPQEAKA